MVKTVCLVGGLVVMLGACGAEPTDSVVVGCADGTVVANGDACVFAGPITETGFDCPPAMPFEFGGEFGDSGESWMVCSAHDMDAEAVDQAMQEADGADDQPSDPADSDDGCDGDSDGDGVVDCRDADPRDPRTDPEDSCNIDTDGDGIVDCRDDDPTVPSHVPSTCHVDDDDDGSCQGMDLNDDDETVIDGGTHLVGGTLYLVSCTGGSCFGIDVCFLDPAGLDPEDAPWIVDLQALCGENTTGYASSDAQLEIGADLCEGDVCFTVFEVCLDTDGQVGECDGSGESCVDDDRDGICDR